MCFVFLVLFAYGEMFHYVLRSKVVIEKKGIVPPSGSAFPTGGIVEPPDVDPSDYVGVAPDSICQDVFRLWLC